MSVSAATLLPPAALALALSLGFLGAGAMVMQLPRDVLGTTKPVAEEPAPAPVPRYIAMRDPIIVAHSDIGGRLRVELGVAADADREDEVRAVLRDDFAPMQARLATLILDLAATVEISDPGKSQLRDALPDRVLSMLNDHFEELGQGRPIREVFVVSFASR